MGNISWCLRALGSLITDKYRDMDTLRRISVKENSKECIQMLRYTIGLIQEKDYMQV